MQPDRHGFRRIAPERVEWGVSLCSRSHCVELAVLTIDGWPFCLACADDEVERAVAFTLNPEVVEMMPGLEDR